MIQPGWTPRGTSLLRTHSDTEPKQYSVKRTPNNGDPRGVFDLGRIFRSLISTLASKGAVIAIALLLGPTGVLLSVLNTPTPAYAATAGTSKTLNFQARLLNTAGNLVADGYYNVRFKIYDVPSAGTALWTDTRYDTNGATAGNDFRIRVVNGYFSVNLGDADPAVGGTAFSGIDWSQQLWLTMDIGGSTQTATPTYDGEMTPRIALTAMPLAFLANNVNSGNTSAASTNSANTILQSGNTTGATSDSGTVTLQSGNVTSGNSGNISIDAGSASGTKGTISIATANASSLILGRAGLTTLNSGALTVTETGTFNGNLTVGDASTDTATFTANVVASNSATGTTGTSSGTGGTNVTSITLAAAGSFANGDVILVDNTGGSGQDYYTRITAGAGSTTITVDPAVSYGTTAGYTGNATITKYNVQNIGAANTGTTFSDSARFFQGYFLGGIRTGAGSTVYSDQNISSSQALYLNTAGSTRLTVSSAGYVGIGTTSPVNKLDVSGDITIASNSSLMGNLYYNAGWKFRDSTGFGGALKFSSADPAIQLITASGNAGVGSAATINIPLSINTSGNIGIGNTNNTYKLDVTGNINASTGYVFNGTSGVTTTCAGGNVLSNQVTQGGIVTGGTCSAAGSGTVTGTGSTGQVPYWSGTSALSGNANFIWDNTNGRLGVGTATPQGAITIGSNYRTTTITSAANQVSLGAGGGSPNAGQLMFGDNTGWRFNIGTNASGTFTERLTVMDTGNVGIGTTNPGQKLVVYDANKTIDNVGNLNVFTSNSQAADLGGQIGLGGANGSAGAFDPWSFATIKGAKENSTPSNLAGYFAVGTPNSGGTITEKLRITSAGNAIFAGAVNSQSMLMKPASGTATFQIQDGVPTTTSTISLSNSLFTIANNANPMVLNANTNGGNTNQLYLATSGSIGLGNSSPLTPGGADARVLQLSANWYPQYISQVTGASADNKVWRTIARNTNVYEIQTLSDAGGSEVTGLQFTRSGNSITNVAFPNGALSVSGASTLSSTLKVNGGSSSNWASLNIGGNPSINANGSIYSYYNICSGNTAGDCTGTGGARLTPAGHAYLGGNLYFDGSNPTISAASYFIAPGGAYFNSGTVYTEAALQARGGVNDDGGNLMLSGSGGNVISTNQFQAPIYYDYNDTNYYSDPNGSSVMNNIRVVTEILQNNGGLVNMSWSGGAGGGLQVGNGTSGAVNAGGGPVWAGSYNLFSSRTIKHDIHDLTYGLNDLMRLQPVNFLYNGDDATPQIGFIAEDVHDVIPEVTTYESTRGIWGIDMSKFAPLLVKSIQEIKGITDGLDTRLTVLESGNFSGNLSVVGDTAVTGNLAVMGSTQLAELTVTGITQIAGLSVGGGVTLGVYTEDPTITEIAHPISKRFKASKPIAAGSVVILDVTAGNGWVTTTNTLGSKLVIGVSVTAAANAGDIIEVAIGGTAKVAINGSVGIGDLIHSDTAEGQASAIASPAVGTMVGKVIGTLNAQHQALIVVGVQ